MVKNKKNEAGYIFSELGLKGHPFPPIVRVIYEAGIIHVHLSRATLKPSTGTLK